MTRWYRAYAGTVKDDKLAEVATVAGCSRSVAIATWHALLESAAETDDAGRFETTARRVAATLGEPAAVIDAAFAAMVEIGMLEGNAVAAWKRRQYESDSSTERSRKHRDAKRNAAPKQGNGDATLQGRSATPPETEAETDSETKEDTASAASSASAPAFDWIEIERQCSEAAGSSTLGSFDPIRELIEGRKPDVETLVLPALRARRGKNIASWRYYVPILAEAILKATPSSPSQGPPMVFVKAGTPEWDARVAAGHKPGLVTFHREHGGDGWLFPAQKIEEAA